MQKRHRKSKSFFVCLFVCFFFLNFLGVGFSVDLVVSEIEIECFCLRQKIKAGRDGNTCSLS